MPQLMHKVINELLVKKRNYASVEDVVKLLERQKDKCNCCGDVLTKRREVDHILPLAEGGSNELDNLQLLCLECHSTKTEHEEHSSGSTRFHTLESQLSPHLVEVFHKSPKPMQFTGSWRPLPKSCDVCKCLDVAGCRSNAILEYEYGLPIFSPLDHVERIMDDDGCMIKDLKSFAMIWVHCPDVDLDNRKQAKAAFPWTGSRWYALGAVIYMLQTGAITADNLVYGIQASRTFNPKILKEAFDTIHSIIDLAMEGHMPTDDEEVLDTTSLKKRAILSTIGIWNSTERLIWKVVRSQYVEDCPTTPQRRQDVGEGLWDFKWSQDILDNRSMRPIGQIALDMEHVLIDKAMRALRKMPNIVTYGAVVDCVFYSNKGFYDPVADFVESQRFPSGKPMFKVQDEPRFKVPSCPIRHEDRSVQFEPVQPWKHYFEDSGVDFATLLRENGGGMILGAGGVGKTVLVNSLIANIKAEAASRGVVAKIHVCALRHAAKALLDNGKTLAHLLYKLKDAREFWLVVDEASEIPLSMWADIVRWKLMDVRFVVVGDFAGQLTPIADRWSDAMQKHDIQDSGFLHSLVNGVQVHLTTCRRCAEDMPHFELTKALYNKAFYKPGGLVNHELFAKELRMTIAELRPKFPMPEGGLADITLTISHYMRIAVNTFTNEILQQRHVDKRWMPWDKEHLPGFTMQPQSCWIWKCMNVIGCTRKS